MSAEKNPEVVGCDASIMRGVWEVREREYNLKSQLEKERQEKSALPSINEDWAARLARRQGQYYKRVEKKAKPEEFADGDSAAPKPRRVPVARVPAPAPTQRAPAPNQRAPAPQRGLPAQAKGKKVQEQRPSKEQLLMNLTRTQPSAMVWGKSWRFNKDLAQREEGTTDWGQGWMFATQQPYTETGKPWPNGPCQIDPTKLHLFEKPVFRVPEEEPLTWALCCDEWEASWKNANKPNTDSSSGQETAKYGFFASLIESHRHNSNLYNSEWSDCWMSTKPSDNELSFDSTKDAAMKTEKETKQNSEWAECWKISNHHGLTSTPQVHVCHSPEWSYSWRVAMMVQNNHHQSEGSAKEGCDKGQRKAGDFVFAGRDKSSHLLSDINKEFKGFSEWNMSWQVPKNDTKPSAEIEKTLKTEPPQMGQQQQQQPSKVQERPSSSTSDQASKFIQLKNSVLFRPRREVTHSMMMQMKDLEKVSAGTEWKESWKMLKHRLRAAQRQRRVHLMPFEEKREKEWKDSWKFTNQPLGQNPEMWQQQWTTTPQIRYDRAREQNHFPHVELPKNGPTGERTWNESWRMSRRQLEASRRSTAPASWQPARQVLRSPGDWQEAWMVSETQHRRDKPSYAQWMDAWKSSAFQSGSYQCNQQLMGMQWLKDSLEIRAKKEIVSVQRAEKKMFHERVPDKQWVDSWKCGSMLQHGASDGQANIQQSKSGVSNEYGSKWGMSFRLANPMPKVDQPWVKCSPNPCYYGFMWAKQKKNPDYYRINTQFTSNSRVFQLWASSPQFLQGAGTKAAGKAKPMGRPTDPRVIVTKDINLKKDLYSRLEKKDKQMDKKWAGCHLLGKTQPRPKRGGPEQTVSLEEDSSVKFEEEWAESWRFLMRLEAVKRKVKSLKGWEEAWKFLVPLYKMPKERKAK